MKPIFVSLLLTLLIISIPVTAQNEPLQIVASHGILGDVVSNVIGDAADLSITMPAGADPHSFEPVPSDLVALANANVVFINGAFFEEGLLEAIENASADMNIVTVSSCVEVISFGHDEDDDHDEEHHDEDDDHDEEHHDDNGEMSAIAELCEQHEAEMEAIHDESEEGDSHDDEDHDEDHDHEHSEGESLGRLHAADCGEENHSEDEDAHEEGEEHAHGACDPHVWMSPHNVMLWTMLIRDTLIDLDPDNADLYTANAEDYIIVLDELMHDFIEPMVETIPEENRILVTSHDSLGYFAARFDFDIVTTIISGGSTLAEPSTADVAEVIDLIRDVGVPAIFGETTVNDAVAQQIADETGAEFAILYSGALSDADGPASTYLDYMRYNVTTIVEALGGGR